jgi:hypothetical protein
MVAASERIEPINRRRLGCRLARDWLATLGGLHAMSAKRIFSIGPVLVVVAFFGILVLQPMLGLIQEKMNDSRFATFAQKIAVTDHIIVSMWTHYPSAKEMSLSLTGDDAKRVVKAVSSGRADRRVYKNEWLVTVKFLAGTNVLGEINVDSHLFRADGVQYQDGTYLPEHKEDNGVLTDLVYRPIMDAVEKAETKELETK